MTVSECIKQRRAVYPNQFHEGNISDEDIKDILKNANLAPSHKLTQPWFFKVFQNEYREELAQSMVTHYKVFSDSKNIDLKTKKISDKCKKSSCIIAIFMNRDLKESIPEWEEVAATAMAVQNMWLTCVEKNIGCYWSTPSFISKMGEYFKLENNQRCLGFFYLGPFIHSNKNMSIRQEVLDKTQWFK